MASTEPQTAPGPATGRTGGPPGPRTRPRTLARSRSPRGIRATSAGPAAEGVGGRRVRAAESAQQPAARAHDEEERIDPAFPCQRGEKAFRPGARLRRAGEEHDLVGALPPVLGDARGVEKGTMGHPALREHLPLRER